MVQPIGQVQGRRLDADWASCGVGSFPVVPSNSVDFVTLPRAFYVGGDIASGATGTAGDIVFVNYDDTTCTWKNVPVGLVIPCSAKRVNATGTTATFIVGIL